MNTDTLMGILKQLAPADRESFMKRITLTRMLSKESKDQCLKAYSELEASEKRLSQVEGYGEWQ